MERVNVRVPTQLLDDIDKVAENGRYKNRSEVIRQACREFTDDDDCTEQQPKQRPWAKV